MTPKNKYRIRTKNCSKGQWWIVQKLVVDYVPLYDRPKGYWKGITRWRWHALAALHLLLLREKERFFQGYKTSTNETN